MGILAGFVRLQGQRENKSTLHLLLDCYDRKLIPFSLYVGHDGRWIECEVNLEGRELGEDGDLPPPPPPSSRLRNEDENAIQLGMQGIWPNLISGWRRRGLQLPQPFPDRGRGATPVAMLGIPDYPTKVMEKHSSLSSWCRGLNGTPNLVEIISILKKMANVPNFIPGNGQQPDCEVEVCQNGAAHTGSNEKATCNTAKLPINENGARISLGHHRGRSMTSDKTKWKDIWAKTL